MSVSSTSSTITIQWDLNSRADSLVQAGFITGFQYLLDEGGENQKNIFNVTASHTFSNLTSGHTYTVHGKVVTTDTSSAALDLHDPWILTLSPGLCIML